MLKNDLNKEFEELLNNGAVIIGANVKSNLKWKKAVNDLALAKGLLKISTDEKVKDSLGYTSDTSFFDWVIVSSYYSIFHSAQALLGLKGVKISNRLHHATLVSFAKYYILSGNLAEELFLIYENSKKMASELLSIFEEEKEKRGVFQYHRLSGHNLDPAKISVENAEKFLNVVQEILAKKKII